MKNKNKKQKRYQADRPFIYFDLKLNTNCGNGKSSQTKFTSTSIYEYATS